MIIKAYKLILVILILLLFLGGCNNKEITRLESQILNLENKIMELENEKNNFEAQVIMANDDKLWYVIKPAEKANQVVEIIGYNRDNITEEFTDINVNGLGQGEIYKFIVLGSIYDCQLVEVMWDQSTGKINEKGIIRNLGEIRNKNILIETMIPEGMPYEKLKWKDDKANEYEYLLGYDGYGFSGTIIWNK